MDIKTCHLPQPLLIGGIIFYLVLTVCTLIPVLLMMRRELGSLPANFHIYQKDILCAY